MKECLFEDSNWSEFYVALALAGLRAMAWKTMSLAGRRLMYLVSGLAIQTFQHRQTESEDNDKTVSDTTDHITNF